MVEEWGRLVHPEANAEGFRRCGVMVGRHFPPHWSEVPDLVAHLCRKIDESAVTPDEAYLEFQQVHPFRDGNGRTGKVLYNYLRRTLRRPVMPPNFFNCSNP